MKRSFQYVRDERGKQEGEEEQSPADLAVEKRRAEEWWEAVLDRAILEGEKVYWLH